MYDQIPKDQQAVSSENADLSQPTSMHQRTRVIDESSHDYQVSQDNKIKKPNQTITGLPAEYEV